MGYIHFRLSQLLLAMYNPSSMALGPEAFDQHKQMEVSFELGMEGNWAPGED